MCVIMIRDWPWTLQIYSFLRKPSCPLLFFYLAGEIILDECFPLHAKEITAKVVGNKEKANDYILFLENLLVYHIIIIFNNKLS